MALPKRSARARSLRLASRRCNSSAGSFPVLGFVCSLCGSWARTIYCLKHLARAAFAMKFAELIVARGPGGNGKDTLANRVAVLLGSYFTNLDPKALTVNRGLDDASQTFLALRVKRFVCIREIEKNAQIKGNIYRTVSDYKSKIKARPLYGEDQEVYPTCCTNVPLDIDDQGKGSQRRTRIQDMPCNFVAHPTMANEKQVIAGLEDNFPAWNPSFFFMLCQVRRILLNASAHEIHPIPDEVKQAVSEELREPWMDELDRFVRDKLVHAKKVTQASAAAEVREAFFKRCDGMLEKREVGLKMAAQGFQEESEAYTDASAFKRTTKTRV